MGRDHTIHASVAGYVKYYRDPSKHSERKYIGVTFRKEDKLPYPQHAERKRRLNMAAFPIRAEQPEPEIAPSGIPTVVRRPGDKVNGAKTAARMLRLREDYSYREDNWQIGRLVKTTGIKVHGRRSRKAYMRNRRWRKERWIAGMKKADEKMKEMEKDDWATQATGGKPQKQAKKKKKPQAPKARKR
jgi:large subunit ribosomal protein L27